MFKPILGNLYLMISLDGQIQTRDGEACTLPSHDDGCVEVAMYGRPRIVPLKWLALISHYEVELPLDLRHRLSDIDFEECHPKIGRASINGHAMIVKRPILAAPGFRLVPGFPKYAISVDGVVIKIKDVKSVVIPRKHLDESKPWYIYTNIYIPKIQQHASYVLHRLVALAWVHNDDWLTKWQVNHKDGNKRNCHADNLEWVTPTENNNHAVSAGLRTDGIVCRFRSARTGEVREFASFERAMTDLGIYRIAQWQLDKLHPSYLFCGEWEMRRQGDDTPWYSESVQAVPRGTKYIIHVTMPDGVKHTFLDTRDFTRELKLWNCRNAAERLEKARALYPGIQIEVDQRFEVKPVEYLNVSTGEITKVDSKKKAQRVTGVSQSAVARSIEYNGMISYHGFAFRDASDVVWDIANVIPAGQTRCILATHIERVDTQSFDSLRQAAGHFNVDRSQIKNRLKDGKPLQGWVLSEDVTCAA